MWYIMIIDSSIFTLFCQTKVKKYNVYSFCLFLKGTLSQKHLINLIYSMHFSVLFNQNQKNNISIFLKMSEIIFSFRCFNTALNRFLNEMPFLGPRKCSSRSKILKSNVTLCKHTTRSRPGQTKPILIVTRKHIVVNYVEMS